MSNKVVIFTMNRDYPFGISQGQYPSNSSVKVRKTIEFSTDLRDTISEKIKLLRKINNIHLINLDSTY